MTGTTVSPDQASLPTPNSTKSYWHKDPSKILLGHRTTQTLPFEADVVIIGSGIAGAGAAHSFRNDFGDQDLKVVMLEAREACWGATGRNGGHCQPGLFLNTAEIGMFEFRNYEAIKSLVEKNDIPCDWRTLSVVHSIMNQGMFDAFLRQHESLVEINPQLEKFTTVVKPESTNPSLADLRVSNAKGAFVQSHAASLWPYKFVSWVLEQLLALNDPLNPSFNLQTNTPVTRIQRTNEDMWIVHTDRGMLATKKILLATNGYTSYLLPSFCDLIVPTRGEMSSLVSPKTMRPGTNNPPLQYSYDFVGHGSHSVIHDDYLIQRPYFSSGSGGELMFGGARSFARNAGVGVSDDSSIDPPAAAYLRQQINVVLDTHSDEKELPATYEWSGIMGYSRDHRPWVGAVDADLGLGSSEGLYICAGFTGHGMPNTWLSARAAVMTMMGRAKEEIDLPESYWISEERLERARAMKTVKIAGAEEFSGETRIGDMEGTVA